MQTCENVAGMPLLYPCKPDYADLKLTSWRFYTDYFLLGVMQYIVLIIVNLQKQSYHWESSPSWSPVAYSLIAKRVDTNNIQNLEEKQQIFNWYYNSPERLPLLLHNYNYYSNISLFFSAQEIISSYIKACRLNAFTIFAHDQYISTLIFRGQKNLRYHQQNFTFGWRIDVPCTFNTRRVVSWIIWWL